MRSLYVLIAAVLLALTPSSLQAQETGSEAEQVLDEADLAAIAYFKSVSNDGHEHLLAICGREVHDFSLIATGDRVWHNPDIFASVVETCKSAIVIFHNHSNRTNSRGDTYIPLPSNLDFGIASYFSYEIWKVDLRTIVSFRIYLARSNNDSLVLEYGIIGKYLISTINNAKRWRSYDYELGLVSKNGESWNLLTFLASGMDSKQYGEIRDSVVHGSEEYIRQKCPDALFIIEESFVCPSKDYFIRIRGTVAK